MMVNKNRFNEYEAVYKEIPLKLLVPASVKKLAR